MIYEYRKAKPADAVVCAEIIREWGAQTSWMAPLDDLAPMAAFWQKVFAEQAAWVALDAGSVVGFCSRDEDNIGGLYVRHTARGQGVGKALLDLAKAERDWITVWAYEANVDARRFYRREGLVEVAREIEPETQLCDVAHRWTRSR